MPKHIAILGAGLIGRIIALECRFAGIEVSLFDRDSMEGRESCAYTGAGMLAPYTELEQTEPIIAALGIESLNLWPQLLKKLSQPVFFQNQGTLVLAHPQDQAELSRFERSLNFKLNTLAFQRISPLRTGSASLAPTGVFDSSRASDGAAFSNENCRGEISAAVRHINYAERACRWIQNIYEPVFSVCDRRQLLDLEPDLPTIFTEGIYLPEEGQIDNRQLLDALKTGLLESSVDWQTGVEIVLSDMCGRREFDFIIDCRGLGSRPDLKQLRGVRGEIIVVEARGVKLNRPIRLMHPRHPIYIVPRENNQFLIGATSIESSDMRPLTVQSALELLSAACTIHQGFAEGTIVESRVNCRPALPDNLPSIILPQDGESHRLIRINGLYRHGFLLSPKLAKLALAYIMDGTIDPVYEQIFVGERFDIRDPINNGETTLAISH